MSSSMDPPISAVREAVARAIAEDLGILGDVTSIAVIDTDATGDAQFVARSGGTLAGTLAATEVFAQLDGNVTVRWHAVDGDEIAGRQVIGALQGSLHSLLAGERCALNFLSHCSGVATLTRRYVRAAQGRTRILDTRKTTPGLRALERAAVRAGGGFNHRDSLSDAILVKDNHRRRLDVARAVERAHARWPGRMVEVECDSLADVRVALDARADRIMVDNMTPDQVSAAVALVAGAAPVEVSGGVGIDTVGDFAAAGPSFISVGALTHSAPVLDIALDFR